MKETVITWRPKRYATKPGINRRDGDCDQLLNTTPMRVWGSEVTRYGYEASGLPAPPAGITAEYYRYASTEVPSAKEVLFLFGVDGSSNKHVYMYSTVSAGGTTWADGWVLLDELVSGTLSGISGATDTTFTLTGPTLSVVADYYNQWLVHNGTKNEYATVSDYDGAGTFTSIQNLGSSGMGWADGDSINVYRWGHGLSLYGSGDNNPIYGIPNVITREGVFRVNGGKYSASQGARGLWVGYINRTFFKGETQQIPYQGTYATFRNLTNADAPAVADWTFEEVTTPTGYTKLPENKTYWAAIGCLYDGYQHGPLREYGTGANVASGDNNCIHFKNILVGPEINKRVTHLVLYLAQDNGNTTSTGRENPYYEVGRIALCDDDFETAKWTYVTASGKFQYDNASNYFVVGQKEWDRRGNSWETNSGYQRGTDTIFSADIEIPSNGRQWLARVYNHTKGQEDLDRLYTNPVSGEGVVQPDVFSLEPDVYVGRALWGDSSYITQVFPTERGRVIVLKDRAVVDMGVEVTQDGSILFAPTVVSTQTGCASLNGAVNTPYGIFFAGYDDIWRYDGRLSPLTQRDWEGDYRSITAAYKQACIAWFRPEDNSVFFQLQTAATPTYYQYAYFLATEDWRQNQYTDTMVGYTVKRDGTVVWWKSGGTSYKFSTSKSDAGAAIYAKWQTGYFRPFSAGTAGIFREAFVNKQQVVSSGTLDANVKLSYDGTASTKAYTGLTKSDRRLDLQLGLDDSAMFDLISIEYNVNASGENGGTTEQVEFGDVEIFAFETLKVRQA